jgi:glycopeptide antibiotics resistance protein
MKINLNKNKLKIISGIIFFIYFLVLLKLIYFKLPWQAVIMIVTEEKSNYSHSLNLNLIPFRTIISYLKLIPSLPQIALKNLLGNIILFMPFGFLIPILWSKTNSSQKIIIISIIFSFVLEISQLILHLGSFDIDDIFLNTLGALLGYLMIKNISNYTN